MKNNSRFLCFISIFLVISMLVTPVFGQTDPTYDTAPESEDLSVYGCFSTDATDSFLGSDQLIKNAKSVFLYELNTQTLMYAWQPDVALPPSSFVKILTAIIAIENGNLDSAVTVTESALADLPASAVSVDLLANEVLTLRDLLYCMLVGSANDAAAVIAQYIAGSQTAFTEMMNAFAKELGCTGSNFTNPHGLHDPQQMTTARDTAKILEYAMKNETFRTVFGATEYTVAATNKSPERYLVTGNYMMSTEEVEIYIDERVTGGRTGVANDSTRCLATVAKSGTMELMCIVMGAASVYEQGGNRIRSYGGYNETKSLLDTGFTGNSVFQILYDGQALLQYDIENADALLTVGPHANVSTVLPENVTMADLSLRYSEDGSKLRAPIAAGDKVCSVEIWHQGLRLAATDLYAMNNVRDRSVVSEYEPEDGSLWACIAVIVLLALVIAAFVFMFATRRGRRVLQRLRRLRAKRKRRK